MALPPGGFVPPTYDLRALGRDLGLYARLDQLADEYLGLAERLVGPAFTGVAAFAARAQGGLRADPDDCLREETDCGARCRRCRPDCLIGDLTEAAERHGAEAYFSVRERAGQFKALLRGGPDLAVLGVACIWMLAHGMRSAEEARIPSQGVLLNYAACEHWTDRPASTDAVVARVDEILRAKAAARGA
ncbi:MAG TPA: DUF116 domain-containing protein [Polyangia bacterium]